MPAYTTHGWEIPRSVENHPKPDKVFLCDGPTKCKQCMIQVAEWQIPDKTWWTQDVTRYNEETLHKVSKALQRTGLDDKQSLWAIIEMQNEGILFRERL